MPRNYSEDLLLDIYKGDPNKTGTALAIACVEANLPAIHVAKVLGVSRMTIHSWFRGSAIRANNIKQIDKFLDQLRKDTTKGILPAVNVESAKKYLEELTIEE
jgi:predicted transcriptional regulator